MSLPDQFYITLVSDESNKYFPDNKKVTFTNRLSAPIFFEQPYAVALTEIYIPSFTLKNNSKNLENQYDPHVSLSEQSENDLLQYQRPSWVPLSSNHKIYKSILSSIKEKNEEVSSQLSNTFQNQIQVPVNQSSSPSTVSNQNSQLSSSQSNSAGIATVSNQNIESQNIQSSSTSNSNAQSVVQFNNSQATSPTTQTPSTGQSQDQTILPNPSSKPTQAPVLKPTQAPVPKPTQAPVPKPTQAPVPNPTQAPVPIQKSNQGDEKHEKTPRADEKSLIIHIDELNSKIVINSNTLKDLKEREIRSSELGYILLTHLKHRSNDHWLFRTDVDNKVKEIVDDFIDELLHRTEYVPNNIPSTENYLKISVPLEVVNDEIVYDLWYFEYDKEYIDLKTFFKAIFRGIPLGLRKPRLFFKSFILNSNLSDVSSNFATKQRSLFNFYNNNVKDILASLRDDILYTKKRKREDQYFTPQRKKALEYVHMLYVYCDIVTGHAYADQTLDVLRIIPGYTRDVCLRGYYEKFINPEFYPVNKNYFDSISIKINNREDDLSFSEHNFEPVYLQLLFKKI